MTAEFSPQHTFTQSQLENQRLFNVGSIAMPEQAGDKSKRVWRKLTIFTGATTLDLAESWGSEALLDKVHEVLLPSEGERKDSMTEVKRINNEATMGALGFVEDGISDELYGVGMNAILRNMTGLDEAVYASPTAKFIAGWTNLGSFASGRFQDTRNEDGEVVKKLAFWKKPWNLVNSVNAEAFIGLLEEIPFGVGNNVAKAHAYVDRKLTTSEAVQLVDGTARAAVTGYHIVKNIVHDSKPIVHTNGSVSD